MSMASLLPMALNTGVNIYGRIQGGENSASAARANALAQARASLANAAQIRNETARREEQARRQGRAAVGRKTAAMAQAGVLDAGTSVGVLDQSRVDAELDALNTRYQGLSRSDALMTDAQNAIIQGKNAAAAAKARGLAGAVGLLSNSLATAGAYGLLGKGLGGSGAPGYTIDAWKYQTPAYDAWKLMAGQR